MKRLFLLVLICTVALKAGVLRSRPDFSLSVDVFVCYSDFSAMSDVIIGPGHDTLVIDTDETHHGDLIVVGNGVVIIDDAEFRLHGILWQQDSSVVIVRNSGHLHVMQEYCSHYPHNMIGDSRFEATDAIIDGRTVYRTFMHDNSTYIARRTHFPFWNFRECYDNSTLILEDVNLVGDLLIKDSCFVSFTRCDTILPWFCMGEGVVADISFPDHEYVDYYLFDSTVSGISGVKYQAIFEACSIVLPGVCLADGCSVIVRNSVFCVALRITGDDTVSFSGISNRTFYHDLTVPLADRHFNMVNSYTQIWCIYTYDDAVLHIKSCYWGEAHARDNSMIFAVGCSTNGFPSSVTSVGNGYFSFIDGKVTAFISSWFNATTYIENSIVAPTRPGVAQRCNIAHHSSMLLCVNTVFDTLPYATDSALVLFAFIDPVDTAVSSSELHITGSAWADIGIARDDSYAGYTLQYSDGESTSEIISSHDETREGTLAIWNTETLEGEYTIELVVYTTAGESLLARRQILIESASVTENPISNQVEISVSPNPFNSSVSIVFPPNTSSAAVYSICGRLISQLAISDSRSLWQPETASGVYLIEATCYAGEVYRERVVYIR